MKRTLLMIFLFSIGILLIPSVAAECSAETLSDFVGTWIGGNEVNAQLPGSISWLIGNENGTVIVDGEPIMCFITQDDVIQEWSTNPCESATITATITCAEVENAMEAELPGVYLLNAFADGRIDITATSLLTSMAIGAVKVMANVASWFT